MSLPAKNIITHAALNGSTLILCTCNPKNERYLVRLHMTDMGIDLVKTISLPHDISFVNLVPMADRPPLLFLGTHEPCVNIYNSSDLSVAYSVLLANVSIAGTNIPESCAVLSSSLSDYLLIGLRDGTLISYRVHLIGELT